MKTMEEAMKAEIEMLQAQLKGFELALEKKYNENIHMEDWHGYDGTDARTILSTIDEIRELKAKYEKENEFNVEGIQSLLNENEKQKNQIEVVKNILKSIPDEHVSPVIQEKITAMLSIIE